MQVRVLGPFEVAVDDVCITPSAPKVRRVLALLALYTNKVVSTDQIIEELWEDRPPFSATTTMQTYIYQLRKLLGWSARAEQQAGPAHKSAMTLRTTPGGYVLVLPPGALDAHRFEQLAEQGRATLEAGGLEAASETLRKALGLWRGSALTEVRTGPVLQAEVVRLEELRKNAMEQRIDADLRLGRHPELIGELTGIVAHEPTHEGFQAKLMLTLYRAGRRPEALQVYHRVRAVLSRELGLEPSAELQRLHQAVLSADPSLDAPTTTVRGVVRLAKSVEPPSQLPPDVFRLVGRDAAVEAAERVLTSDERSAAPVVVSVGAPGSGKSAFCVHVAHRVRLAYPDGQLYARIVGPDGVAVPPEEVLADFLRAAGAPEDRIPASLEARSRMFRSWTASRKVLVVLDDVVSAEQLRELLPTGLGCATLVASRRMISDPAITQIATMLPLDRDQALEMLVSVLGMQRVGREADAVRELIELSDGLPVALRSVASRLQLRPHWPVGRLVRSLRGCPPDLAAEKLGIAASVRLTYDLLPAAAQAAFWVVAAAADKPVSPTDAAVLLRVEESEAEASLEDLVEFGLAEVSEVGADALADCFRYRFRAHFRSVGVTLAPAENASATQTSAVAMLLRKQMAPRYPVDARCDGLIDIGGAATGS